MQSAFSKMLKICFALIFSFSLVLPQAQALLYPPAATSLSLTSSVSYPIPEYLPDRKIIIDWCFAMSYTLPGTVSAFYNIPIWPIKYKPKTKKRAITDDYSQNYTQHWGWYEKYERKMSGSRRHAMDLSAAELYQGIEDYFASFGFHEICLLRSVCELAQHPFDDRHRNIITELLTFLLTPSLHQGFEQGEEVYREAYEAAELQGFLGKNCTDLYVDCKKDFLGILTKVLLNND